MGHIAVLLGLLTLLAGLLTATTVAAAVSPTDPTIPAAPSGNVIVDPAWRPVGGVGGQVQRTTVQPDGKIIVTGPFESVAGVARRGIARLNTDGSLDPTFDPGIGFGVPVTPYSRGFWNVSSVTVMANGRIVVVGGFASYNGVPRGGVVRILQSGAIDPSFNPGSGFSQPSFTASLVQPDGRMVVAGDFTSYNGTPVGGSDASAVVRLQPGGALEKELVSDFAEVASLALAPDGKIVAGGQVVRDPNEPIPWLLPAVTRWRPDGTQDTGFPAGTGFGAGDFGVARVSAVVVQPDSKTVVGGRFDTYNGITVNGIIRLNANGSLDTGFDPGDGPMRPGADPYPTASATAPGSPSPTSSATSTGPSPGEVLGIILQPDGRILVAGDFTTFDGAPRAALARLNSSGSVDLGFFTDPASLPDENFIDRYQFGLYSPPTLQTDGGILIGGDSQVLRLRSDGRVDGWTSATVAAGVGTTGEVRSVAVQTDGKTLFAAGFYNGDDVGAVGRLHADGTVDSGFEAPGVLSEQDSPGTVYTVSPQPDGKVLIGGTFTTVGGLPRAGVARLNADGSVDPSFNAGMGPKHEPIFSDSDLGEVLGIVRQPDGRHMVWGLFDSFGGVARPGIARLNADGSLDATFNPTLTASMISCVFAAVLQPDGKVVVSRCAFAGDGTGNAVLRLNPDGAVDATFDVGAGFNGGVTALGLAADGKVVAGGDFSAVNWTPRNGIVRLNANGAVDVGFNPGSGIQTEEQQLGLPPTVAAGGVRCLYVAPDGSTVVGGEFTRVGGVAGNALARLNPDGSRDPMFNVGAGFGHDDFLRPATVRTLAQQSDGRIVVGGSFEGFDDAFPSPWNITRLAPPVRVPTAPRGVSAANGNAQVAITFTAPASFGGAAVTTYEYSMDGSPWMARNPASTTSPLVISALANGVAHQVRLRARNVAGPGPASEPVTVRPVAAMATVFVPVAPARVVDTRTAVGGLGPVVGGQTRVMSLAMPIGGGTAVVPPGAVAVAYNLTVPNPGSAGHVRVMPGDTAGVTSASAVNYRVGETIANAATVKVDGNRQVKVYAGTTVDVVMDVVGYFIPAVASAAAAAPSVPGATVPGATGRFTGTTPVRVYDAASDPAGPLAPGSSRLVSTALTQLGANSVVPSGASAVAYNITVVRPAAAGHLRVMPGDAAASSTSTINWSVAGDVIANASVVAVDGQRQLRVHNGSGAAVRFLVDVVGFYSATGQAFYPIDPVRVSDSRWMLGGTGAVPPGDAGIRTVGAAAISGSDFTVVPSGASAMGYNLTVVNSGGPGHARVFPADKSLVTASALNWPGAGFTRANASVVAVSTGREVKIYNGSTAPADMLVDVNGYYK